jgi:hypothetical protein
MGRVGHIRTDCQSAQLSGTRSPDREGRARRLIGEVRRRVQSSASFGSSQRHGHFRPTSVQCGLGVSYRAYY